MIVRFIYAYRSKVTRQFVYVGSAFDVCKRDKQHQHGKFAFDRHVRSAGRTVFSLHILEAVLGDDAIEAMHFAVSRENHWMDELRTYRTPQGFNFVRASFAFDSEEAQRAANAAKKAGWTEDARKERAATTTAQWKTCRESLLASKAAGWTPAKRAAQSERIRLSFTRPEVKAAHAAVKEKRIAAGVASRNTKTWKQKQSESQKRLWADSDERAKRIAAIKNAIGKRTAEERSLSVKAGWLRRKAVLC